MGFGYRLLAHPNTLRNLDPLEPYAPGAQPDYFAQGGVAEEEADFFNEDQFCAKVHIRFEDVKDPGFDDCLDLIDNENIEILLQSISRCVSRPLEQKNKALRKGRIQSFAPSRKEGIPVLIGR